MVAPDLRMNKEFNSGKKQLSKMNTKNFPLRTKSTSNSKFKDLEALRKMKSSRKLQVMGSIENVVPRERKISVFFNLKDDSRLNTGDLSPGFRRQNLQKR